MNTEKVQQEITAVLTTVKQASRKQYPVAKHQITSLTELGILELMPRGFGYTDAAVVIEAARDGGKLAGGMNAAGEGDVVRTNASALYLALNEVEEAAEVNHNGHTVIISKSENAYSIELVLSNGFETEQQGYYKTYAQALEIGTTWAEEDWSDYL
jgi:hypothetical protein